MSCIATHGAAHFIYSPKGSQRFIYGLASILSNNRYLRLYNLK